MSAHVRHWPREVGGLDCLCGWHAATRHLMHGHMWVWFPAMTRVKFEDKKTPEGYRRSCVVPGHEMVIRPHPMAPGLAVVCQCGHWTTIPAVMMRSAATVAREHVRQVVYDRCLAGEDE